MENAFQVTVITAVYKVEPFLREAIDSVIAQDIGFAEHVQLILVDDGSPDGCGAICDEYAARYPHNIEVIHKENGGVSSARNAGLSQAKGRFVNFMDSDDKLSPETLREVCAFFDRHLAETDIVSIPLVFFDGKQGTHTLNFKFNRGDRVIDLDKEWTVPQLHVASSFIKRECVQRYPFDPHLAYGEDALVVQKVLSDKCTLGVVSTATYFYRQRSGGAQSAIQMSGMRPNWYLPCTEHFHLEIIRFYMEKYGYLPRFIQFTLMYDMQWRILQTDLPTGILPEEDCRKYRTELLEILQKIDDEAVLLQRNIGLAHKLFALKLKYGRAPDIVERPENTVFCYNGKAVAKMSDFSCRIDFLKMEKGACAIEGCMAVYPSVFSKVTLEAILDGKAYPCREVTGRKGQVSLGEHIVENIGFAVELPLARESRTHELTFCVIADGRRIMVKNYFFPAFAPIGNEYEKAYFANDGWIVSREETGFRFEVETRKARKQKERAFLRNLWKRNLAGGRKAVLVRRLLPILRFFHRRPLWLISDRAAKAGDNGEAFFRYMRKNHREIDARFVINADCADYAAMKAVGPVLKRGTLKQKLYLLLSEYVISSQAEIEIYNPFRGHFPPYRDILAKGRFIFLQHGVTENDVSDWLGKYQKNLYGFVTVARPEAESILHGNYHYTDRQVWLTGFPRFDRLYRVEEKRVTIMPTWRKYLMAGWNYQTDKWSLAPGFAESRYLQFYNALLTDRRLLDAADRLGYQIDFLLHPTLLPHSAFFRADKRVHMLSPGEAYRDIYARSQLVVTDYSSAVFDFAYLRKPVLYAQFDLDEFYRGAHVCAKGYFEFERDGFGEVTYDLDTTVNRIIEYMENDCRLKDVYRERIERFFAFDDQNNCARVYDRIRELEGKR